MGASSPDIRQDRRRLLQLALGTPLLAIGGSAAIAQPADKARREHNKAVVRSYIDATDRGDIDRIEALVSPDVKWWIVSRGDFDRKTAMTINRLRFSPAVARKSSILGVAAEDDRVAIEYETMTTRDGAPVFIVYHHLFQVQGDVIVAVSEWTDPRVRAPRFKTSQAFPEGLQPWPPARPGEVDEAVTRKIAEAFLASGPTTLSPSLTAPDYRWWINGRGYGDMQAFFAKLTPDLTALAKSDPVISFNRRITGMTVEGERAAVRMATDAVYANHDYNNRYHVIVIVRNGKVIEMREHTDRNASVKAGFPDI
ncbi:MAG: nuclear transport factor 2 family protein [Phenylobacterium sp.]|nr:nuclear transport factor 2 family protein [Phenylobacterium sp.]